MKKASVLREKCCAMVLHGGRPDPVEVVDALTELEAERDAAHAAGRKEALEEAAALFDDEARHDWGGVEYSEAVGIPISNRDQLVKSSKRAEENARMIRALQPQQKDTPND